MFRSRRQCFTASQRTGDQRRLGAAARLAFDRKNLASLQQLLQTMQVFVENLGRFVVEQASDSVAELASRRAIFHHYLDNGTAAPIGFEMNRSGVIEIGAIEGAPGEQLVREIVDVSASHSKVAPATD